MIESTTFEAWLRMQLGQVMAWESNIQIPDSDVNIEVRRGGQWTQVRPEELR